MAKGREKAATVDRGNNRVLQVLRFEAIGVSSRTIWEGMDGLTMFLAVTEMECGRKSSCKEGMADL